MHSGVHTWQLYTVRRDNGRWWCSGVCRISSWPTSALKYRLITLSWDILQWYVHCCYRKHSFTGLMLTNDHISYLKDLKKKSLTQATVLTHAGTLQKKKDTLLRQHACGWGRSGSLLKTPSPPGRCFLEPRSVSRRCVERTLAADSCLLRILRFTWAVMPVRQCCLFSL